MRRKLLPPDHPQVGTGLVVLGALLVETGKPAEAEPLLRESLEILGGHRERGPDAAWSRHELGRALAAAGRTAEAEEQLAEALAIRQELLSPDHPDLQATAGELAALYEASGRGADAERVRGLLHDPAAAS